MKATTLILALCLTAINAVVIKDTFIKVGSCSDCSMNRYFGQIGLKICGKSSCCFTGYFKDSLYQGEIYVYEDEDSGECHDFNAGDFADDAEEMAFMSATVYHIGTDGVYLEKVGVIDQDGERFECKMPAGMIDDHNIVKTSDCYWK